MGIVNYIPQQLRIGLFLFSLLYTADLDMSEKSFSTIPFVEAVYTIKLKIKAKIKRAKAILKFFVNVKTSDKLILLRVTMQ